MKMPNAWKAFWQRWSRWTQCFWFDRHPVTTSTTETVLIRCRRLDRTVDEYLAYKTTERCAYCHEVQDMYFERLKDEET